MRVRFMQDWTFAGRDTGVFYMKDFKAGQEVRLTSAQYARAKSKGVVQDVESRKPRKIEAEIAGYRPID